MDSVAQVAEAVRACLHRTDHEAIGQRSRARIEAMFSTEAFTENLAWVLFDRVSSLFRNDQSLRQVKR